MVFKGCERCNGDLRVEEDIVSRLEDLVCLQCGHRQAVPAALVASSRGDQTDETRQLVREGASRVAA